MNFICFVCNQVRRVMKKDASLFFIVLFPADVVCVCIYIHIVDEVQMFIANSNAKVDVNWMFA